ncbi:MAG: hypothetical protein U1E45_17760 [Geminicoccaceae bacterium]
MRMSPRASRSGILAVVVSVLLVGATAAVAWYLWSSLEGTEISTQGIIAMGLGIGLTVLVGVGLMRLAYYSHRRGFDEEAGRD